MRVFFCLLFLLTMFCAPSAASDDKKTVLFLNSYQNGYPWSDAIYEGARQVLNGSDHIIDLRIEYMDTKKHFDENIKKMLYDLYRYKFRKTRFDVIIVSDNNGFDFVREYHDDLFPGVPVVFCGVNDLKPGMIPSRDIYTGVVENFDARENLERALKFHPGRDRLVVIGDNSPTGRAIRQQVKDEVAGLDRNMEVEFWDSYSLDEILARTAELADRAIFYFIPFVKGANLKFYSAREVLNAVWKNTGAPIYSNWEFLIGSGNVGGKMLSGLEQGSFAARIALRIFKGEKVRNIPIVTKVDEPYVFDNDVIKALGIRKRDLPAGSTIINEPPYFVEINRQLFWTIITSIIILAVFLVFLVFNIVERRYVEEKIKDQLSFLKILMDTIPIPIYYKDEKGAYKGCNVSFEKWFGIRREDILGKGRGIFRGTSQESLIDNVDETLFEEAGVHAYDASIENADGVLRSVVLHKAAYRNTKGDIAGLVGVIVDISDRKKAENDLRRAEEKYRSIFENSALGIFRTTPEGRYLDANPSFVRMLGFRKAPELIDALAFSGSDLASAVEKDGAYVFEREYWRKDGRRIITSQNVRVVRSERGEVLNYEGFVEDVTKRRLAEQRLRESQQMLKAVLDNIPMHVYWMDRSMRLMGGNKSFCTFFGIDGSESAIGKTAIEVMPDADTARQNMQVDMEIVAGDTPAYHMQWTIPNLDGELVWLVVNKVPLHDDDGNVFGVLSTAEDVTQNVRLERQLVQSQKMEAIGTLAGGIAHDFNNILTSIMNSTELAMEDVDADSFAGKDLERVLKASERGSRLVKQILTFSRPTQEGFQPTNVADVVSEAVALIKASLPRNIEIRDVISPGLTACLADPTQIHQIVMNLCTNSFHALRGEGGRLEVHLVPVCVSGQEAEELDLTPGEYQKLTIADDGPGISQEIMDKIFDPFFTTKGKGEGTGLGLAVVHGIIKGHKGACRVSSKPGERTSFDIFLPVMKEVCPDLFHETQDALPGSERVMFVEDDPDQLELIPRVLAQLGYSVDGFKGPMDALDFVKQTGKEYDLVVTDYDMPELNGLEFAEIMADFQPGVPVILVSGRKQAMDEARGVAHIRKVLIKPYNKGIISGAIRQVLDFDSSVKDAELECKGIVGEHG